MNGFSDEEKGYIKEALVDVRAGIEAGFSRKWKDMEDVMSKNTKAVDSLLAKGQIITPYNNKQSFGEVFSKEIESQFSTKVAEFKAFKNDRDAKVSFQIKTVGTMLSGTHLTGDPQHTYNNRQGLVPAQKINFRDLIPTAHSETGTYVTYRETGGEGEIGEQTEGEEKSQIDYDFSEIKQVQDYVAGYVDFSKQFMYHLPWLQNTLVRMLMRDFFKKENSKFFTNVASNATGFSTTTETDDAKAIIDILMGRLDRDFNNSYILVRNSQKGRILKLLYENGFYMGSGSVVGSPDGTIRIADTPVVGASWVTADKIMIIDNDFIERVETEALNVTFSYESGENFKKNLVTARIECFEELNLLRTDAHSYLDMGNES